MPRLTSIKTQVIIFLACFAIALSIKDRDPAFLLAIFIAVLSCVIIDSCAFYLKNKKLYITDSSIISGMIIGYVLSADEPWWIFLSASFLAIGSKHLLRFNKKHLFNPAALGIFLVTLLPGAQTQWRGTYLWYILVPAGVYFTFRIGKPQVIIGFFSAALLLFGVQAVIQRVPLMNVFWYLSYFYIFIMVIEPKTTPIRAPGKLVFGIGVASLIFILTESGARFDVELFSLLVMNIFVPLLNRIPGWRVK